MILLKLINLYFKLSYNNVCYSLNLKKYIMKIFKQV